MDVTITIPDDFRWMLEFYEKKAEVRSKLTGQQPDFNSELFIAIEQYAIQGLKCKMDFKNCEEI